MSHDALIVIGRDSAAKTVREAAEGSNQRDASGLTDDPRQQAQRDAVYGTIALAN